MAVTEPKTTDTPVENMTVDEPKTVETKESIESPPAESTTEKVDAKTTTTIALLMDDSTVETPSETPAEESSKEGDDKPKKRPSPTKEPEDHPDAKKIAVEAEGDEMADAKTTPLPKDETTIVGAESKVVTEAPVAEPASKDDSKVVAEAAEEPGSKDDSKVVADLVSEAVGEPATKVDAPVAEASTKEAVEPAMEQA
jgi:hypothetical protein